MAWFFTVVLLFPLLSLIGGCSVKGPMPVPHTMEETLYESDIVVYAKHTNINMTDEDGEALVVMDVFCVFKNRSGKIGSQVILHGDYLLITCYKTHTEVGESYVIALEPHYKKQFYSPDEPYFMERAAFLATDETLQRVRRMCGMQNATDVQAPGCTKLTGPPDDCETVGYVRSNGNDMRIEWMTSLITLLVAFIYGKLS